MSIVTNKLLLPPANEVWAKVIFSEASSRILYTRGGCLPQCMLGYPLPRRPPCQGDPPCQAHTQGGIEGGQIQAHTRGGSGPGQHPMGKLSGMRTNLPPPPPPTTTAVGGIHPTGMHFCVFVVFVVLYHVSLGKKLHQIELQPRQFHWLIEHL